MGPSSSNTFPISRGRRIAFQHHTVVRAPLTVPACALSARVFLAQHRTARHTAAAALPTESFSLFAAGCGSFVPELKMDAGHDTVVHLLRTTRCAPFPSRIPHRVRARARVGVQPARYDVSGRVSGGLAA